MKDYDNQLAVRYAIRWALGRNPAYFDYSEIGGDCTNFASQCLFAGSGIMDYTPDFGWYYIDANYKAPAWTGVDFLYRYLLRSENTPGPRAQEASKTGINPGDLIQISFDGERYSHTLVVLTSSPVILVAAHSEDSLFRPLNSYEFRDIRYLHIVGVHT